MAIFMISFIYDSTNRMYWQAHWGYIQAHAQLPWKLLFTKQRRYTMDIDVIEEARIIMAIALTEVGIILLLVLPIWPSEA